MTTHERAEKMVAEAVGFKPLVDGGWIAEDGSVAWKSSDLRDVCDSLWSEAVRLQAEILERESGDKR